jgi:hypothetical protein
MLGNVIRTVLLTCLSCAFAAGQSTLDNQAVIKMVKADLGEEVILTMINSQPGKYALQADDVIALKQAGVSQKIISAMVTKGSSGAPAAAPPAAAAPAAVPGEGGASAKPAITEVGVYYMKGDQWVDLLPEVVNWKTGGVMKSIATVGVVKGDVNGRIIGAHSKTSIPNPVRILVYVPEGTAITEYQLLKLRESGNAREFRTVTGGVFHVSGGAQRDLLPVENKKVASRTYELLLSPKLAAGEYGVLPPGGSVSSSASSQLGKIYSFHLLE